MTLAPTRSVPPRRPTTTPVTLSVTHPGAVATFLRGVPLDDAFWRRVRYQCSHCGDTGTTVVGGLWRTGQGDELYYLHSHCLSAYKALHSLQSAEGRVPLVAPAPAPADLVSSNTAGGWRTWTAADPTVGAITTLYDPDHRAVAYAVGRDDPALVRVAARLNGGAAATTGAVQR